MPAFASRQHLPVRQPSSATSSPLLQTRPFDAPDPVASAVAARPGHSAPAATQGFRFDRIPIHPAPSSLAPIQRKVTIEDLHFGEGDEEDFNDYGYGDHTDPIERTVAHAFRTSPDHHHFESEQHWKQEVQARASLIKNMHALNAHYTYNWKDNSLRLPEQWEEIRAQGTKQSVAFAPTRETSPKEAVDALFNPPENEGPYHLDCSSAMAAAHYGAMSCIHGENFDEHFPREQTVINPEGVERVKPGSRMVSPPSSELYDEFELEHESQLLPGDWVYMKNYADYDETHEGPTAAWAGEHSLYLGGGHYAGFGVNEQSGNDMVETLRKAYNEQGKIKGKPARRGVEESDKSLTGVLPGPLREVRRIMTAHQALVKAAREKKK